MVVVHRGKVNRGGGSGCTEMIDRGVVVVNMVVLCQYSSMVSTKQARVVEGGVNGGGGGVGVQR